MKTVQQVEEKGYSPPRRDKILQWQSEQDFRICPNPDDPDACNVYNELTFPDGVYGLCTKITSAYKKRWFVQDRTTGSSVRPRIFVQSPSNRRNRLQADTNNSERNRL